MLTSIPTRLIWDKRWNRSFVYVTHTGELHDKIAEQTGKARRSTREVKVPNYFSITVVLLRFIPKGLTKQRSNIAAHLGTSGRRYLSDP